MSLEFAQFRDWQFESAFPLSEHTHLMTSWTRTQETLRSIRDRLLRPKLPEQIETVYVCGSMGRMEQLPSSDCDLVIVVDRSTVPESQAGQELFRTVWDRIADLEFERPKPDGIFSQVATWDQLVDRSTLGVVDEIQFVYGKRIQLLLDSQPVYQLPRFEQLAIEVVSRMHQADANGRSDWIPLLSELIRYWRSLCTRTFWIDQPGTRRFILTKLNHSRLMLIAGLLCLLGEASAQPMDSRQFLQQQLHLTSLERILACTTNEFWGREILSCYDTFLSHMSDADFIARLGDSKIETLQTPEFQTLETNSQRLKSAINQLIAQRSTSWSPTFRESLVI